MSEYPRYIAKKMAVRKKVRWSRDDQPTEKDEDKAHSDTPTELIEANDAFAKAMRETPEGRPQSVNTDETTSARVTIARHRDIPNPSNGSW